MLIERKSKMSKNILQCLSLDYRFQIIKFINDNENVSVNDIVNEFEHLKIKQSIVSQTLTLFKNHGLIDFKGEKQKHIYFIKNKYVKDLINIVEQIMKESKK